MNIGNKVFIYGNGKEFNFIKDIQRALEKWYQVFNVDMITLSVSSVSWHWLSSMWANAIRELIAKNKVEYIDWEHHYFNECKMCYWQWSRWNKPCSCAFGKRLVRDIENWYKGKDTSKYQWEDLIEAYFLVFGR